MRESRLELFRGRHPLTILVLQIRTGRLIRHGNYDLGAAALDLTRGMEPVHERNLCDLCPELRLELRPTEREDARRIQEIVDLRVRDLQLTRPFQVRLFGKGKKERYCPIWPELAAMLRSFCKQRKIDTSPEAHVFVNHRDQPLSRFGVRHILLRCLEAATEAAPTLSRKRLHPHSMRHSTAVALLKSGVDLSTISHMLGHASPTTTNRYAKVDLEMKRKAIAKVRPVSRKSRTPWARDATILDWLESL